MTHSIKHLLHIASSQENVFENLTTIKGLSQWWTTETSGSTELGGIIEFSCSRRVFAWICAMLARHGGDLSYYFFHLKT